MEDKEDQSENKSGSFIGVCILWTTVIIFVLLLLAAIAGAIIYAIYRPQRPSFAISDCKISTLSLTSTLVTTKMNLNIITRNPNKKLAIYYNPIAITVKEDADDILLGNGMLPSFVHGTKNTKTLEASVASNGGNQELLDNDSAAKLKTVLKSKEGVSLKVLFDTRYRMRSGRFKTPRIGIRVVCDGIQSVIPTGKSATTASLDNAKCKVYFRFKIWKWTI